MLNPCARCSFDEGKCPLKGNCRGKRQQRQAQERKHNEDLVTGYEIERHWKRTSALHLAGGRA